MTHNFKATGEAIKALNTLRCDQLEQVSIVWLPDGTISVTGNEDRGATVKKALRIMAEVQEGRLQRESFEKFCLHKYKGTRHGGRGMLQRNKSEPENYQLIDIQWRWCVWQEAFNAALMSEEREGKISKPDPVRDILIEALQTIAKQLKVLEMAHVDVSADIDEGYDKIIDTARTALKQVGEK